ncbi:MAG: ComEA family DNA-binding protein [Gemmataceae bacterium]|nr:ComEA family DNA-binding protein [Gemmataceae bacterium]
MPESPLPPALPPPSVAAERLRTAQLALAFLLGVGVTFLVGQYWRGRTARPLVSASPFRIDLNHATPAELAQLPRVGPALAERLVDARPFESVESLKTVPGFGPATFDRVAPHVAVSETYPAKPKSVVAIDPNTATLEQLQTLPGIGPKLAQRIIETRAARPFISAADMRRVPGLGPKTVDRIRDRLLFTTP